MPEAKRLADTLWESDLLRADAMRERRHNNHYPSLDFSNPDPNWRPSTPADWAARQRHFRKVAGFGILATGLVIILAVLNARSI